MGPFDVQAEGARWGRREEAEGVVGWRGGEDPGSEGGHQRKVD